MNIEEFIQCLEIRPQMYIFPVKMESIFYFTEGFLFASRSNTCNVNSTFFSFFGKWIYNWIINNKDQNFSSRSFAWFQMIQAVAKDEEEALELFFILSKEFFQCYHNNPPEYWNEISY